MSTINNTLGNSGGSSGGGSFTAGGDLSGNSSTQTVIGLQTVQIASTAPTDGYVLTYVGADTKWEPKPATGGFTAGGDLSGTSTNQTVQSIHGTSVPATPSANQVLVAS